MITASAPAKTKTNSYGEYSSSITGYNFYPGNITGIRCTNSEIEIQGHDFMYRGEKLYGPLKLRLDDSSWCERIKKALLHLRDLSLEREKEILSSTDDNAFDSDSDDDAFDDFSNSLHGIMNINNNRNRCVNNNSATNYQTNRDKADEIFDDIVKKASFNDRLELFLNAVVKWPEHSKKLTKLLLKKFGKEELKKYLKSEPLRTKIVGNYGKNFNLFSDFLVVLLEENIFKPSDKPTIDPYNYDMLQLSAKYRGKISLIKALIAKDPKLIYPRFDHSDYFDGSDAGPIGYSFPEYQGSPLRIVESAGDEFKQVFLDQDKNLLVEGFVPMLVNRKGFVDFELRGFYLGDAKVSYVISEKKWGKDKIVESNSIQTSNFSNYAGAKLYNISKLKRNTDLTIDITVTKKVGSKTYSAKKTFYTSSSKPYSKRAVLWDDQSSPYYKHYEVLIR